MKVGVTGHQSIPWAAEAFVREEIATALARRGNDLIGVSSLAAGADQIFASQVLDGGGQLLVVVPCARYEASFDDAAALARFRELLLAAVMVEQLPFSEPSEAAFLAAGHRVIDESDALIAVWDGLPARGLGGTGDAVAYAKSRGKDVEIIWPTGILR